MQSNLRVCLFFLFFLVGTKKNNIFQVTTALASSKPIPKISKVAVIGGSGRLGRRAVDLLLEKNISVKCLLRSSTPPEFLQNLQKKYSQQGNEGPSLELVTGDVTDPNSLSQLLEGGCQACLALHGATRRFQLSDLFSSKSQQPIEDTDMSHAKQTNYVAMKYLLTAARNSKTCNHIIRITGKGESPYSFFSILINGLGSMAKGWNYEGEQVLRTNCKDDDTIDYTIIRPGVMKEEYDPIEQDPPQQLQIADNGQDLKVSAVSYQQIAEVCVEALFQPMARGTTLTAMNAPIVEDLSSSSSSVAELLQNVQADSRVFPDSLIDEHKRAVKIAFTTVAAALLLVIFTVASTLF